jgi:GNAT superfamily N-acetyltransferase
MIAPRIDPGLVQRFVDAALEATPPQTLDVLGRARTREALVANAQTAVARTEDLAVAEAFRKWCPIEGASAEDYLYRVVTVGDVVMIASPRFAGGDRTRPFVHIETSTHPGMPDEEVCAALGTAFAHFSPNRIRWFDARSPERLPTGSVVDFRIVAGSIDTIVAHRPATAGDLRLVRATGLDWYDRYVAGYEHHFAEYPELVGRLNYETRETLQSIIDRGTLFEAWADEGWVGVIGVWPERDYYVDGYVIAERMLVPEVRGRGLGAALVWHLAATLELPGDTIIFGTIAPPNVRSMRSALSVGRRDVGGYVFRALR